MPKYHFLNYWLSKPKMLLRGPNIHRIIMTNFDIRKPINQLARWPRVRLGLLHNMPPSKSSLHQRSPSFNTHSIHSQPNPFISLLNSFSFLRYIYIGNHNPLWHPTLVLPFGGRDFIISAI